MYVALSVLMYFKSFRRLKGGNGHGLILNSYLDIFPKKPDQDSNLTVKVTLSWSHFNCKTLRICVTGNKLSNLPLLTGHCLRCNHLLYHEPIPISFHGFCARSGTDSFFLSNIMTYLFIWWLYLRWTIYSRRYYFLQHLWKGKWTVVRTLRFPSKHFKVKEYLWSADLP